MKPPGAVFGWTCWTVCDSSMWRGMSTAISAKVEFQVHLEGRQNCQRPCPDEPGWGRAESENLCEISASA